MADSDSLKAKAGEEPMEKLVDALQSLQDKAFRFLARHPAKNDVVEYGAGFLETLEDIAGISGRTAVVDKFQSPGCSKNHYAGGRFCRSSVAVRPGNLIFPAAKALITSKHFLDSSGNYSTAKIRIMPDEPSLMIRFRKWRELYHGGAKPEKPFFWFFKEPKEIFDALAYEFVHGAHPEYAAAFFEDVACLPAVLARYAEAEPAAIRHMLKLANKLEHRLR